MKISLFSLSFSRIIVALPNTTWIHYSHRAKVFQTSSSQPPGYYLLVTYLTYVDTNNILKYIQV